MKLRLFKLFVLLVCPLMTAVAQDNVNTKFGKPTKEEMEMTVYAPEPDADAVVLCHLTNVEYTVQAINFLTDYREKMRIKVLKPGGARFAKVVVPYKKGVSIGNSIGGLKISSKALPQPGGSSNSYFEGEGVSMTEEVYGYDSDESVEDIKATAFNMEGGKMVKTALKKSDIVTTKIDDHNYQVEFTVPNVKEGTVIEYEYRIHSQLFWELRDWYAQSEIPVIYAKLDMNIPSYLIFNIENRGIQQLTYTCTLGTLKFKIVSDPLANPMSISTNHYVYEGRNLIGMPKDDYVWCAQDYYAGITAELKSYRLPGMMSMDYAKTWEQIDEMVLTSDDLGIHLSDHSPLASELKEAQAITDLRERVAAVHKVVMGKVKWNGKYAMSPAPTAETLQKGEGSNADINLLLIQSLSDAGLNAAPVLLRTRDLGQLPYNFPSIRKLSTFIVGVILPSGGNVYFDASSPTDHFPLLASLFLVERARLMQKNNKSQWVNLQKMMKTEANILINATLDANGTLSGKQSTRINGGPTEETDYAKQGQVSDGSISICPFPAQFPPLIVQITPNPFIAETRRMPVEFPCTGSNHTIINIALPEGYTAVSAPVNTTVTTPDKGIECRILTTVGEGKVQMSCRFKINKLMHSENNYADLRQLFDLLSKYISEPLVIKKK